MTAGHSLRAWSCQMRIVVEDDAALPGAVAELERRLARVEAIASRFRPDSSLSAANRSAGRPVPVPRELIDLVAAALDAAERTDGAVDPTVGVPLRAAGYERDIDEVAAVGPTVRCRPAAGDWGEVRLDRTLGLLTVPAGVELDLGATAKAFTADQVAWTVRQRFGTAVLVELGGDIALAGDRPDGWPITVAERAGGPGHVVNLLNGGIATSTTTIRRWLRGDRAMHHILDPRTGAPADGPWRTVTVAAGSALAANVASTASIVLGGAALDFLSRQGLAARLVGTDGRIVTTAGWPASPGTQWRAAS